MTGPCSHCGGDHDNPYQDLPNDFRGALEAFCRFLDEFDEHVSESGHQMDNDVQVDLRYVANRMSKQANEELTSLLKESMRLRTAAKKWSK